MDKYFKIMHLVVQLQLGDIHEKITIGNKPNGELHLGHYIGAIIHFIEMQKDYESFCFCCGFAFFNSQS